MARLFHVLAAVAVIVASWGGGPARAQIFSPGELHRQHAKLEGIGNCLECHEAGNRLSDSKCLKCHIEIKVRDSQGRGYHGRAAKSQECASCHAEHKGRNGPLVVWKPSKNGFPHSQTGWRLEGKHAAASCKDCHQPRRIKDPFVEKLLTHKLKTETFLGLGQTCRDCHFDEHRGQLKGGDCAKCHTAKDFAPATKFSHTRNSRFPLTGKHRRVSCRKCHASKADSDTPSGVFPAPVNATYAVYRPLSFRRCIDCHRDPHKGERGIRCETCHSTKGWDVLNKQAMDVKFHRTTRFPLEGAHVSVTCQECHGPFSKRDKAVFKGIPFARCDDCHHDAHVGQLDGLQFTREGVAVPEGLPTASAPPNRPDCRFCHTEMGFAPSLFELEDHSQTAFLLKGSHEVVGCGQCHVQDRKLLRAVDRATKTFLNARHRPTVVSNVKLGLGTAQTDCKSCHTDIHEGQFAAPEDRAKDCAACHVETAFLDLDKFDHNRDTNYALKNKHEDVNCAFCHVEKSEKEPVVFRGQSPKCAACHVDVHAGQFETKATSSEGKESVDCARCHLDTGFIPAEQFDHQDPNFAQFPLEGRHLEVDCEKCHPRLGEPSPAEAAPTPMVQWFKGVPTDCAGCHVDQHDGEFDKYTPTALLADVEDNAADTARRHAKVGRCTDCHQPTGWLPGAFDHEKTGYSLIGAHGKTACVNCHQKSFSIAPSTSCADCHRDVHQQTFGQDCQGCHTQTTWRTTMDASAHLVTGFPLIGRHGALLCTECHQDRRDRTFIQPAVSCAECHRSDYDRTSAESVDHRASNFPLDCKTCHQPARFQPAAMVQHERCYPLLSTQHRGVSCAECHATLAGTVADGSCRTQNQTCRECHEHRQDRMDSEHSGVEGYEWESLKCVACHSSR